MAQQNTTPLKEKIIFFVKRNGPSLPVHIAREVGQSMLFASAFLSELLAEKKIKISHMRIGGSPLYYIQGQEHQLTNFAHHLKSKEREAHDLLAEKKFLSDSQLEPAIRVALRSIKDYAFPFRKSEADQEIHWRYLTVSNEEINHFINPPTEKEQNTNEQKEDTQTTTTPKETVPPEIEKTLETSTTKSEDADEEINKKKVAKKDEQEVEKPIVEIKPKQEKKGVKKKEDSAFVKKVKAKMMHKDIEIIEEKDNKKKEFSALARMDSEIGKIELFIMAKEKKRITENDIALAVQRSQTHHRLTLIVAPATPDKKAQESLEKYGSIIKLLKL